MAKFNYKNKDIEEVKGMSVEEFSRMLPSRMRRSLTRGLTENQKKLLSKIKEKPGKFHKTTCREMIILPEMLGTKIGVHNGKEYVSIDIVPEMLGHRLGEFATTRKRVQHSAPGFGATRSSKFVPLK
ncbi:MAG: 30S ribosomal protein S19 [Candidatus Aenigmarchaeota archaeon]|nr:30S ribosomal protein S19 [Candidatus Aenigmarchaeota archaeon]